MTFVAHSFYVSWKNKQGKKRKKYLQHALALDGKASTSAEAERFLEKRERGGAREREEGREKLLGTIIDNGGFQGMCFERWTVEEERLKKKYLWEQTPLIHIETHFF